MASRQLPWCKLYSDVCIDPDVTAMPLEQQAVYFRLLAYAGKQEPRGSIPADNLPKLARWVANGNLEVLTATLDYLINDWGTLEERDDTYYFRTWSKHQKRPSDNPDAQNERQKRSRAKKSAQASESVTPTYKEDSHADVTRDSRDVTRLEVEGELRRKRLEGDVEGEDATTAHPIYGLIEPEASEGDRVYQKVESILELDMNPYAQQGLLKALREYPDELDPVGQAEHWQGKYGGRYERAGERLTSFRRWLDVERDKRKRQAEQQSNVIQMVSHERPAPKPMFQPTEAERGKFERLKRAQSHQA